jgi:outer membrane protein assembly factor BamE (lipoprotein component of BamABCDE complex)
MEIMTLYIMVGVITLAVCFMIVFSILGKHKDFINNATQIKKGMTMGEVVNLMGEVPTTKENNGNQMILIWEKNQWKGIQNGGTLTRAVKVVFEKDKVVSVTTKNLDKSTFW